ncbi:adenylate/guanylate cyclase domain-containing protein [Aquabacterium humicola]|uniref:adenylate/guanylate cyclase domain-containing protein n=1 Tax=Aquabacterium humicola TaxID=3237377 RepID=UPI002542EFD8|nr:adenylate/guanylate cyclase domain-containing protein [Rubrivivax pictus]
MLTLLSGMVMPLLPWMEEGDLRLLDAQFEALRRQRHATADDAIAVITIDEPTLAAIAEPLPLVHARLGKVLAGLANAGARAVALDVILPERSFDALLPGNDHDLIVGMLAVRRAGVLVLARTVDEAGRPRPLHAPFLAAAGPDGTGLALLPVDRDGVVRRFDEKLAEDGSAVPTLVGTIARRLGMKPDAGLMDFSRRASIPVVSLKQVLDALSLGNIAEMQRQFGGRIVFIGTALPFVDRHRIPLAAMGADGDRNAPGVMIHAWAMQALMDRSLIQRLPPAAVAVAGLACALSALLAVTGLRALITILSFVALIVVGCTALLAFGFEVPTLSLVAVAVAAALARIAFETMEEILARRRLRRAFAGYVSPAVMDELEAGRLDGMSSARRFLCVMFLDVRGFTGRSEHDAPEQVTAVLNVLFEQVTEVIHRHGGTIKEFMGDGVMALFGAPQSLADPVASCFAAARDIVRAMPDINRQLTWRGQAPLDIGIGAACGEAVVGHIGAAARHAYGAVGDCVNVASRLEGLTKDLGYPLVVSEDMAQRLGGEGLAALGRHALKGHSAVAVYGWRPLDAGRQPSE